MTSVEGGVSFLNDAKKNKSCESETTCLSDRCNVPLLQLYEKVAAKSDILGHDNYSKMFAKSWKGHLY